MLKKKIKGMLYFQSTIRDALEVINKEPIGIVILFGESFKLVGITTDGDIRRALLNGYRLEDSVTDIMNTEPITLKVGYKKSQALRLFSDRIKQIPIIDEDSVIVDVLLYSEFCTVPTKVNEKITVRAKAPLRISFAGGGTDVNPYIATKGGVVLSSTINKYCFGTLKKRDDKKILIFSKDYDMVIEIRDINSIEYDGKLDLIKAVIKLMNPGFGMELYLKSDTPPGSGLGGSSTAACTVAGLINHLREDKLDSYQLAEVAFQAERIELGIDGGWQDQYAAVFGGFNFIEFKEEGVFVHPLKIKEDILNELECSMLLCFTDQTRVSGEIVKRQTRAYISNDKKVTESLDKLRYLTIKIKDALLKGHLNSFGYFLDKAWQLKKRLDKNITNGKIDKLYNIGIKNGAIGGKVLGAGGGGYILFICPHLLRESVAEALRDAGSSIMDFDFDFRGLQTWAVRDNSNNKNN